MYSKEDEERETELLTEIFGEPASGKEEPPVKCGTFRQDLIDKILKKDKE